MADKADVKFERELKLNRNYGKSQHAFGVFPPAVVEKWPANES